MRCVKTDGVYHRGQCQREAMPGSRHCSLHQPARGPHYNFVDMTGQRFGKLVVESRAPNASGNACWNCRCDCGALVVVQGIRLRDKRARADLMSCAACKPRRPGT